jgi:hypothetical protein
MYGRILEMLTPIIQTAKTGALTIKKTEALSVVPIDPATFLRIIRIVLWDTLIMEGQATALAATLMARVGDYLEPFG